MVAEHDRRWQTFLRLKSTREATVYDVTRLCRWWFWRYYLKREGWKRIRRGRRQREIIYVESAEEIRVEEFERLTTRTDVVRLQRR